MYWPIGAPRIYAASNHGPSTDRAKERKAKETRAESDDAAEHAEETGVLLEKTSNGRETGGRDRKGEETPLDGDGLEEREHEVTANGSSQEELRSKPGGDQAGTPLPSTDEAAIVALRVSRNGHIFATITATALSIWQSRPTAILATVVRSPTSLGTYGPNVSLLIRPDSAIFVVQSSLGYLITYSLAADPSARVYRPRFPDGGSGHARRHSVGGARGLTGDGVERTLWGPGEGGGVREVSVRFRMVIRVDAGIVKALALDDELVVATQKPAAVQCIRWTPDSAGKQTSTELLSRMSWLPKRASLVDMVHDRPMSLSTWVTSDGRAYAVQRLSATGQEADAQKKLFRGFCFHTPAADDSHAVKAAINARFSLIALACADGSVHVYTARDYVGNIPLTLRLRLGVSSATSGSITFLTYSPDGYCLFAGFERGWAMWSVFGKAGASSFNGGQDVAARGDDEGWLRGVREGSWLAGGAEMLLVGGRDERLWVLEMARSAVTGCFSAANIARSLLQTNSGFMIYRGYGLSDLTSISADASLWSHVQIPNGYLVDQWPLKAAVISPDGRYVAVAGRRGLAHYSVNSGRWKTFVDDKMEDEFTIRGGLCWHRHILIAAVESGEDFELRLYSREAALDQALVLHVEPMSSPVVHLTASGEDSLLAYTYENILYHFVVAATAESVSLVLVGQIAFHGIVRAPARVRAVTWVLPDAQLQDGDPSRDVAVASVLFLVDGKLVLLQPSVTEGGELKYDMRVVAQSVEYYVLMRDQAAFVDGSGPEASMLENGEGDEVKDGTSHRGLQDSLWIFDGSDMRVWMDVQDVIRSASAELARDIPPSIQVALDFYPLSALLDKGIVLGVDSELVQRRDVNFAHFRLAIRSHLFLPRVFRHHLSHYDQPAALHLTHHYQHLRYFPHALEVLLHDVLDDEVDRPASSENPLLPTVLSFLSSFPEYLDILVQCTRKTEVRSWRTLFAHLPPPQELFEESLQKGMLKTAGGYLLILHTFEELGSSSQQLVRLLGRAKEERDWELCKELARFLMALDESGATLRKALELVELRSPAAERQQGSLIFDGAEPDEPREGEVAVRENGIREARPGEVGNGTGARRDYFSSAAD
ncbi:MAG: hypothetical protein M1832_000156 [Thelocarpon impressellum]|nr:MAG: hypothetical protein M1832_000156 [Thelocarpon impressellum]